jgi:DNA (cytosine-5)-methyltransferase 1
MTPRILDLCCCEGGAGEGYRRAGFNVVGVDIEPQPNYPFEFRQLNALIMLDVFLRDGNLPWDHFDAIHASPPCQGYLNLGGVNRAQGRDYDHPDLIAEIRERLIATGLPYVIENVADARPQLRDPVRLCGSSFGLPIRRHRLFETNLLDGLAPER